MEPQKKRKERYLAPDVEIVEFSVEVGTAASGPEVEVNDLGGLILGFPPAGASNDVYAGNRMTESGDYFGYGFTDGGSHF